MFVCIEWQAGVSGRFVGLISRVYVYTLIGLCDAFAVPFRAISEGHEDDEIGMRW